jgi:hypothetical protein
MFNLALNIHTTKTFIAYPSMDYLTWYIDNYLNHDEDYRHAITIGMSNYLLYW